MNAPAIADQRARQIAARGRAKARQPTARIAVEAQADDAADDDNNQEIRKRGAANRHGTSKTGIVAFWWAARPRWPDATGHSHVTSDPGPAELAGCSTSGHARRWAWLVGPAFPQPIQGDGSPCRMP